MVKKVLSLSLLLVIIDQIIKGLIAAKQPVIDLGFVVFHFVMNTGASFGILQNSNLLLTWVALIVLGSFMLMYDRFSSESLPWVVIACGGIISNLIDRIFRGFVVDYIDLGWFPVFNIADSMIVIGFILLAYQTHREEAT